MPRTGEIGAFKIVSDKWLAAGVRRLEAVTSLGAVELLRQDEETLNALSSAAQTPREELARALAGARGAREGPRARGRVSQDEARVGRRPARRVRREEIGRRAPASRGSSAGLSIPELRNLSDTLRSRIKSGVVVVGTASDGKTSVVAAVTPDLDAAPSGLAGLPRGSGKALGGSGGGKPDLAQAGGKQRRASARRPSAAGGRAVREAACRPRAVGAGHRRPD